MLGEYAALRRRTAIAGDLIILTGAFVLAHAWRQHLAGAALGPIPPLEQHLWLLAVVLAIWLTCLGAFGFYRAFRYRRYAEVVETLVQAHAVGALGLLSVAFAARRWEISRLLLYLFLALSFVGLATKQLVLLGALRRHRRSGRNARRALVVGTPDRAARYIQFLAAHPHWGVRVIGVADDGSAGPEAAVADVPVLGGMKDLPELVRHQPTDEVVFTISPRDFPLIEEHLALCEEMGLTSRLVLDLPRRAWTREDLVWLDGVGVLSLEPARQAPWPRALKRLIDIGGAVIGLLIFAAVYTWAAPRIRRDSPGPVLFSQVRVGRNGRLFALYKLRTMYVDAEARRSEMAAANEMQGAVFKVRDDPRITPLGKVLRARHLDELPQFWNVLRGEMSLVGTRPPTLEEVECYRPHHRRRLSMKPGITGLWQLAGNQRVHDFEEIVRLDCEYIDTWSVWLDLQILARTVLKVTRRTGW